MSTLNVIGNCSNSGFTHVKDNFVGSNGGGLGVDVKPDHVCPVACRPADHKDWLLC